MAESYSTSLKITLIGDGDLAGTWGGTTNTNWNLVEQAVTGVDYLTTMGDSNYTLTNLNGISDEARNQVIVVPSSVTLSATRYVYAPFVNKTYVISNQSAGGQAIYIQGIVSGTPTGSPLLIPNGVTTIVYCDGANGFYAGATGSAGNFLVNGNFSVTGNEVDVGNITVGGNLAVTGTTTLSGPATAPTVSSTDSSTNIATTAFVKSNLSGLGTMSTQNANNVAIIGGTINGVSGTNSGLSVGYATNAGSATTATNATNATTAASCSGNAATATNPQSGGVFITSSNIGSQSVNYASVAGYATNAGSATTATTATTASNANAVFGKTKLGLGITGETWQAPGNSINTQYYNGRSYPIEVAASCGVNNGPTYIAFYINGTQISQSSYDANGSYGRGTLTFIVPPSTYYQVNGSAGTTFWYELY